MFLGVALLTVIVCYWIPKSRFGLALFSIREDEEVAEAFGINVNRHKMGAYVLSSLFPALLGRAMPGTPPISIRRSSSAPIRHCFL